MILFDNYKPKQRGLSLVMTTKQGITKQYGIAVAEITTEQR